MNSDESRNWLLPALSRELAISLGKVNYCLQPLIGKGLVDALKLEIAELRAEIQQLHKS